MKKIDIINGIGIVVFSIFIILLFENIFRKLTNDEYVPDWEGTIIFGICSLAFIYIWFFE